METETTESENFVTFDDAYAEDESTGEETTEDNWGEGEKEDKPAEKVKEDLKPLDDDEVDAEGKNLKDKPKKEEKKEDKKEEEDGEEEEVVEEKEEVAIPGEVEEIKSKLRMRMGNELFNVDSTATFPVKIDGKVENVNVQELINNYSGKTAWDKKFTEVGKERKNLEFETKTFNSQKEKLNENMNKVLGPLKDATGNPLESLLNLVEMSGDDPYTAYRRVMEANLEELSSLMDMNETERELFFHKKKDELQGKVAKQRQVRTNEETAFNQALDRVDKLRQAHNVSEDEFVDASEELEESFKASGLDPKGITEADVVDFASLKPHIAKVRELVEPYEDNIADGKYGDVVAQLSRSLRDGKADVKAISEILKRNFSVEEDVKDLNTKIYQKTKGKPQSKVVETEEADGFASFDDL